MKCAIFEEHSFSCVVYFRFSGTLFPVSMLDGEQNKQKLVNCLLKLAQEKSVVRWADRPAMTIAVDLGRKATKQINKQIWEMYYTGYTTIEISSERWWKLIDPDKEILST